MTVRSPDRRVSGSLGGTKTVGAVRGCPALASISGTGCVSSHSKARRSPGCSPRRPHDATSAENTLSGWGGQSGVPSAGSRAAKATPRRCSISRTRLMARPPPHHPLPQAQAFGYDGLSQPACLVEQAVWGWSADRSRQIWPHFAPPHIRQRHLLDRLQRCQRFHPRGPARTVPCPHKQDHNASAAHNRGHPARRAPRARLPPAWPGQHDHTRSLRS
jgi:hypothetical protein